MFINFSNHNSSSWSDEQITAAKAYGNIEDLSFPSIDPKATKEDIQNLAVLYVNKIMSLSPACVMCQGEFCFSYAVINLLKERGIQVVAACSERVVQEEKIGNETKRVSIFKFIQFREY